MTKKQTVSEAVVEDTPAVPAESLEERATKAEQVVRTDKRSHNMFVLFVNDDTKIQTSEDGKRTGAVPVGSWYCMFINSMTGTTVGPIPMMTDGKKGKHPMTGFVQLETLRNTAQFMWDHRKETKLSEQFKGIEMRSSENKIMSAFIADN